MRSLKLEMKVGSAHKTKNNGDVVVVAYNNCNDVEVEFVNTGTIAHVRNTTLRDGFIKDPMVPSVCGIGFLGVGSHKASIKRKPTKAYKRWVCMMERCYSEASRWNNKSYANCTVCKEWHNFQNFAQWFESNYQQGMELDKDITIKGNKEYSPAGCKFVPKAANVAAALSKKWRFQSPTGENVEFENLSNFCRENNLNRANMGKVHNGNVKSCKGWRSFNEQK